MPQAGSIFNPADIPFVVRRGHRETNYPIAPAWATAEVMAYRIDNIPVRAGKFYTVQTAQLNIIPSVTNDVGWVRIRYNESGPVTVANGTLLHTFRQQQIQTGQTNLGNITTLYTPSTDLTTLSVGVTISRAVAGSGSSGVRLWGSPSEPLDFWIKLEGDDPGISGTAL